MSSLTRSAALATLVLLGAAIISPAQGNAIQLEAFDRISVCAPLNILVMPSTGDAYMVDIKADNAASIRASVSSSVLSIETMGSIHADGDIEITVSMPASALHAVEIRSSADVFLAPGFNTKSLSLAASQLGGAIAASQLTAEQLSVSADGLGKVTVEGTFKTVDVRASGASSVHVAGLQEKATLQLSGATDVVVTATNTGASIMGTTQTSKVLFNQGKCSLKGALATGSALCVKRSGLKIAAAPLRWTCKADITGSNMCQSSGSSASTFTSTGSDCSVMTWKGAKKAASQKPISTRRLRQATVSSVSSSSSSGGGGYTTISGSSSIPGSLPTSYTYTTTSTGSDGQPSLTSCSFVNNKGGCQVNGVPVPVQFSSDLSPAPAPAPATVDPVAAQNVEAVAAQINEAATTSSSQATAAATGTGGTSCVFVNGIGGCQTTG